MTLTFDPTRIRAVSRGLAEYEARRWCGFLGYLRRQPVGWLYALERNPSGSWHVHALVIGAKGLSWTVASGVWRARNGVAKVVPVHDGSGAVLYATKYAYQTGDIVISDTLARYRHKVDSNIQVVLTADHGMTAAAMHAPGPSAISPAAVTSDTMKRATHGRRAWRVQTRHAPPAELDIFLTPDETATLLRKSRKAIYAMVERDQIPGVTRLRRRILFHRASVINWIDQKSTPSPKES